ncbi:MAG: hypothetical protein RBU25_13940 [Lentisphaeria bacterium]|jgi:hypothetical protein|nr:hypothetical protein [Lentisphaeria bacterium]
MLKLNASYSKKIPVEDREFSSQSYHCSVEVELPDGLVPEELDRRIHETFELVRGSVEAELGNGESRAPSRRREPDPRRFQQPAKRGNTQPASPKQIGYLCDIAARRGMSADELDHAADMQFGAETIARLTREQASRLIDWLASAGTERAA